MNQKLVIPSNHYFFMKKLIFGAFICLATLIKGLFKFSHFHSIIEF